MKIDIFQIDAFTDKLFGGNPAAVCPLNEWLEDDLLQKIAAENNLAETAFYVPLPDNRFHIRWFTPDFEMDLCGHATLASAFVIFEELNYSREQIVFTSNSGDLIVTKLNHRYELNFPSRPPQKSKLPEIIIQSLNILPIEVWKARDYLLLYESEDDIKRIKPNQSILNQINIDPGGIIFTAKSERSHIDFVSRLVTPQATVFEDPVTGSAHCTLAPFWAERLGKTEFRALQLSERRGELFCTLNKNRVKISGAAVKYLQGTIEL